MRIDDRRKHRIDLTHVLERNGNRVARHVARYRAVALTLVRTQRYARGAQIRGLHALFGSDLLHLLGELFAFCRGFLRRFAGADHDDGNRGEVRHGDDLAKAVHNDRMRVFFHLVVDDDRRLFRLCRRPRRNLALRLTSGKRRNARQRQNKREHLFYSISVVFR